jgi:hypothetical protein
MAKEGKTFLTAMWPILWFMRLLGWFPVKRISRDKLKIVSDWCHFSGLIVTIQFVPASLLLYRALLVSVCDCLKHSDLKKKVFSADANARCKDPL